MKTVGYKSAVFLSHLPTVYHFLYPFVSIDGVYSLKKSYKI